MAIEVPPRNIAGSLQNRQAKPLTGLEVSKAIEKHLMVLTDKLLSDIGLLSDEIINLTEKLRSLVQEGLSKQNRLQRINITYPKVGWNVKTRLEKLEDDSHILNAEVELDLERNVRLNIHFGESGLGNVIKSLEEEKLSTPIPDKTRREFGLPVEAEYIRPDGTVGRIDINELAPQEKRAARTVDVGRARTEDTVSSQGSTITLPSQLPEVTLDDLIATPPDIPKELPTTPLPSKGSMAQVTKPNVKFRR
jgi:hypothetical protein